MSVRKGDRGEGKLKVLNKARELKKYSLKKIRCDKAEDKERKQVCFPKSTRWLYAAPIADEIRAACTCIRYANSVFVHNAHNTEGWVLKCDIHHYFESIRHDVAKAAVEKRVPDARTRERVYEIIDSFGEQGLGLGSQVSQLIALAVLDDLDHFIKERLRIKHYIRYMDDFVLIHHDKEYLKHCRAEIEHVLQGIGVKLNKKTALYPLRQGVKLLNWRFIVTDSGAIIRKMNKKMQSKQRQKLKKIYAKEMSGEYAKGTARESLVCYLANLDRGDTYFERRKMIKFFDSLEASYNGR